jgi:Uncharacterized protein predicted to be involved in DNA repair (RAMP superfamily)
LFEAMTGETQEIADNKWTVRTVLDVAEKKIAGDSVHIRMMSPLVVTRCEEGQEGKMHMLGMKDAQFENALNASVQQQAEKFLNMPENQAQVRVHACGDGFRAKDVHVMHKGSYLRSTVGDMMLSGNQALLKLLYQSGMGEMRDEGFGLFEIVE